MKKIIVLLAAYLFVQNLMIAQEKIIVDKNLAMGGQSIGELSKSIENSDAAVYYFTIEHKYTQQKIMLTLGKLDDAISDVDNLLKQSQSLVPSSASQQDFEVTMGGKTYKVSMMTVVKEIVMVIRPDGEIKLSYIPADDEMNYTRTPIFRIDRVGETDMNMVFQTNYPGWKVLSAELGKEKKKSKKK